MVREVVSKKSKKEVKDVAVKEEVAVVEPAVVEPVVVEPTETKPKSKKSSKAKSAVVEEPASVSEPEPVPVPVVQEEETEKVEQEVDSKVEVQQTPEDIIKRSQAISNLFEKRLSELISEFSTLKSEFKQNAKSITKDLKYLSKHRPRGKKNLTGLKKPNTGFTIPTKISDELASFLGVELGTKMARTQVSKLINKYVKENNLQNKQLFNPDEALTKLFNYNSETDAPVGYLNLQKYLKHHFYKNEPAQPEIVVESDVVVV